MHICTTEEKANSCWICDAAVRSCNRILVEESYSPRFFESSSSNHENDDILRSGQKLFSISPIKFQLEYLCKPAFTPAPSRNG